MLKPTSVTKEFILLFGAPSSGKTTAGWRFEKDGYLFQSTGERFRREFHNQTTISDFADMCVNEVLDQAEYKSHIAIDHAKSVEGLILLQQKIRQRYPTARVSVLHIAVDRQTCLERCLKTSGREALGHGPSRQRHDDFKIRQRIDAWFRESQVTTLSDQPLSTIQVGPTLSPEDIYLTVERSLTNV